MYTGPKIEITGYQKGSILKPDEMDALRGGQDTAMGVMLDKLDKRSKLEKEASKIEPMSHTDTLKKNLKSCMMIRMSFSKLLERLDMIILHLNR